MKNPPIEGTCYLDGLLECQLNPLGNLEESIEEWRVHANKQFGLSFHAQIDNEGLSIIPDDRLLDAATLPGKVEDCVGSAIGSLLSFVRDDMSGACMSTIRSVSYGEGVKTLTVYAVNGEGEVDSRSRSTPQKTCPPCPKNVFSKPLKIVATALVLLSLGIVVVLARFGHKPFISPETVSSSMIADTTLSLGPYEGLLEVSMDDTMDSEGQMTVKLKSSKKLNDFLVNFSVSPPPSDISWQEKMAVERIVSGAISLELRSQNGKLIDSIVIHLDHSEIASGMVIGFPPPPESATKLELNF